MAQLQEEETIQATKEIGYESIELQRETAPLIPQLQEKYVCALDVSENNNGVLQC